HRAPDRRGSAHCWLRGRPSRLRCVRPGKRSGSMSSRPMLVKRTPTGSASSLGILWTSCSSSPSSFAVALIGRARVVLAGSFRIVILTGRARVVVDFRRIGFVTGGVLARIWAVRALADDTRVVGEALICRDVRGFGSDELSQHRFPAGRVIAALPGR